MKLIEIIKQSFRKTVIPACLAFIKSLEAINNWKNLARSYRTEKDRALLKIAYSVSPHSEYAEKYFSEALLYLDKCLKKNLE